MCSIDWYARHYVKIILDDRASSKIGYFGTASIFLDLKVLHGGGVKECRVKIISA
jgi:hypothetical protein